MPIANQLYMILCPQHTADLLLDPNASKFFYDRSFYADPKTGKIKGFMGMQFFETTILLITRYLLLHVWKKEPHLLQAQTCRQVSLTMRLTLIITLRQLCLCTIRWKWTRRAKIRRLNIVSAHGVS